MVYTDNKAAIGQWVKDGRLIKREHKVGRDNGIYGLILGLIKRSS